MLARYAFATRVGPCSFARPIVVLAIAVTGCMVGPSYRRPAVSTASRWSATDEPRVTPERGDVARWWHVFDDPTLDMLVDAAYRQNLTLQAAGLRVLQAEALRGVAIGGLYPQTQALSGSYTRSRISANAPGPTGLSRLGGAAGRDFDSFQGGFDVAWEVDLWGRFRRSIEAADASLLASVADYDAVLTSLVSQVAATYVQIRVLEARLTLARDNVRVQRDSLEIARVRYEAGGTSDLDVQQAASLLNDTEATIPALEIQLRQADDALSVLLGVPPANLTNLLGSSRGIPAAPVSVAVGIPADLLWQRPDVRRAEEQLAAQSARIGVAVADLLPRVQLTGTIGLSADDAARFLEGRSFEAAAGPRFDWPVLNYGRLINAVRFQDASFQELVANYANSVLRAQQEVEDGLVGYLRGADQVVSLTRSVDAANRAVDLSLIQYRAGAADYTRVLTTQQAKLREDDLLASSQGGVTQSVISLYKALGGGWEVRGRDDFVPEQVKNEMRARTWWGGTLDGTTRAADVQTAAADLDPQRPWWKSRWWWPKW